MWAHRKMAVWGHSEKQQSTRLGVWPQEKPTLASWSWTSGFQNCEKSISVGGILWWEPEQANTRSEGLTLSVGWNRPAWVNAFFNCTLCLEGMGLGWLFSLSRLLYGTVSGFGELQAGLKALNLWWYKKLVGKRTMTHLCPGDPRRPFLACAGERANTTMCLGRLGLPSCRCWTCCISCSICYHDLLGLDCQPEPIKKHPCSTGV